MLNIKISYLIKLVIANISSSIGGAKSKFFFEHDIIVTTVRIISPENDVCNVKF
jgi:hypothetical protein